MEKKISSAVQFKYMNELIKFNEKKNSQSTNIKNKNIEK